MTFSIFSAALNHQIIIYGKLSFYSGNKVIAADLFAFDDLMIYNYFHGILRKHCHACFDFDSSDGLY